MPTNASEKQKMTGAEEVRWDLSGMFESIWDPRIQTICDTALQEAEVFESEYRGKLDSISADELKVSVVRLETLKTDLYRVSQYVHLTYSVDTQNTDVEKLVFKIDEIGSKLSNYLVFFRLELGRVSDARKQELVSDVQLHPYDYMISQTFDNAQFNLSEPEEQMINLKDLTGVSAHRKLYSDLTSSFQFEMDVDGEKKKMNGEQLRALRLHPDEAVRRKAMRLFYSRYEDNKIVFASLYNNVVKDFNIEREKRGYRSAIDVMNRHNDLDGAAVDALHDVTIQSNALVHQYYELKQEILGLKKLTLADIYAPMPEADSFFSWEEAKDIVLEGFSRFDEDFYQKAKRMFDDKRIDGPSEPTKRGGAYCSSSVPQDDPYVFLNYLGRPRDVATMAHELGHAIHAMYSAKQPLTYYHSILPLAETASVFAEMAVTDLLLERVKDPLTKQAILTDKLEDMFATSHRQNMFSCFERSAHSAIFGQLQSADELCDLYWAEIKKMFGKSVVYTDEYRWEWSTIPHIFEVPFYVYSYNFGNLLVMALYQQYKDEGVAFIPKFKEFLSLGSSRSPQEIARVVGADISSRQFWEKSIASIEGMLGQLKGLRSI